MNHIYAQQAKGIHKYNTYIYIEILGMDLVKTIPSVGAQKYNIYIQDDWVCIYDNFLYTYNTFLNFINFNDIFFITIVDYTKIKGPYWFIVRTLGKDLYNIHF